MTIRAVDHVQLAMPPGREDDARAFFVGILGLAEVPKPPVLAGRGGAWFEGAVKVHVGVEADFRPARKAHVAFVVDDLAELVEACRAAGLEVADGEPLDGWVRGFVHDPFGNRIELMQPTAD